ncbi:MAG: S53 family peptidase, partial [Acidobacteriaceae bacterium]
KIDAIPANADRIDFSGTAAQANAAFQTQLHQYSLDGKAGWANATEIHLPQALASMALGVEHLNTFRPRPHAIHKQVYVAQRAAAAPQYTVAGQSGTVNLLAPSDIATIYNVTGLYNNGITGKGQTIAIVGQTDITVHQSDIALFRSLSGLSPNLPKQVVVPSSTCPAGTTPSISAGDLQEADIDVEWSGAIARDATILYVTVCNSNQGVFDSLVYAIQNPLANNQTQFVPVISISYGGCEIQQIPAAGVQQLESVFEQANAQGQTIVASSGDDGSADCDNLNSPGVPASHGLAANYPSSSQFVTAVGGTSFSGDIGDSSRYWNSSNNSAHGSALSYIPETTWNNFGQLSASGGGASALFSKPSWQTGAGVPNDGMRDVPDVSLASDPAHDGYVLCTKETDASNAFTTNPPTPSCGGQVPFFDSNNRAYLYGGTSIAAPQLAGMIALWNQQAGNTGGVGNANPIFYLIASNSPGAFHDVTTGSNAVPCQPGSRNCVSGSGGNVMSCCSAGAGYDQATGLGSVDATAMGAAWPRLIAVNAGFSMLLNPKAI